jgi:glucosyl-3-phosphoglycerate synthase
MAVRTLVPEGDPIAAALAAKGDRTVSVCVPCRDEVATIGTIVKLVRSGLVDGVGLVDELIVVDDRSTDDTALVAADAGARVVAIEDVHGLHGPGHGKGNALWASLVVSSGDLVVWCDGDVTSFRPEWIAQLVGPLLADGSVALVKASYHRPTELGGGGRTTELVARPLLSLLFPDLAALDQPLAGEYAGRRTVLEELPFVEGWGVEVALLIDVARRWGSGAIAEVDLGVRHHRHRSLQALGVQAAEVAATVLGRAHGDAGRPEAPALRRADGTVVPLNVSERPPVREVRRRAR